jgi:hypothetical protein
VFTELLLRNGLHNPVVPPLLGPDDIENTASSLVACWTTFTELLPGNTLIKSVTISFIYSSQSMPILMNFAILYQKYIPHEYGKMPVYPNI